jgi:hypothetical protein
MARLLLGTTFFERVARQRELGRARSCRYQCFLIGYSLVMLGAALMGAVGLAWLCARCASSNSKIASR